MSVRLPRFVFFAAPAAIGLLWSASRVVAATSLSQFGITWTFDRDYPCGTFANGDFWVVGPVRIVSIVPATVQRDGAVLNGSMLNPVPYSAQGYDSRIKRNPYAPALNVAATLPLTVWPGTSLLSAASYDAPATRDNPQLRTIAVLTVLDARAPPGSFRPPYVGTEKPRRWNIHQLRYDRLRSLPRVPHAIAPADAARAFERPWIEQKTNWTGRYLHPGENQPTYGREMAHTLAAALLSLQLDYSLAEKEPLAIRLVQYGIDIYGAALAGARWDHDGAHNQGRKMPLLLAAVLLDDPGMLEYADARKHFIFQEDQQTWYVTPADVGRPLLSRDGRPRLSYRPEDVGLPEWGEKHAGNAARDGRNWNAYYRNVSGSCTIGHVLAARLMGLEHVWNWPAVFDYYDRYWSHEQHAAGGGPNNIARFTAEMWAAYRQTAAVPAMTDYWEPGTSPSAPFVSTVLIQGDLAPAGAADPADESPESPLP